MHATDAVLDQIGASRLACQVDHFSFGQPQERVLNFKLSIGEQAEELRETTQDLRMSCAGGAGTYRLLANREIEADNTVLIEADSAQTEDPSNRSREGRIQKRSGTLSIFASIGALLMDPDRDVKWRIAPATRPQLVDELLLPAEDLRIGSMAH
jgi:hypothetical protein